MRISRCAAARAAVFLMAGLIAAPAEAQRGDVPSVDDVVVESRAGVTTVLIKTVGTPPYQTALLDKPYRLLVDFTGAEFAWRRSPLAVASDPVREIRGSQYRKGLARLVIELTRKSEYAIEARADGVRVTLGAPPSGAAIPANADRTPAAGTRAENEPRPTRSADVPAVAPPPAAPALPVPARSANVDPRPAPVSPLLYGVIDGAAGWIAYIQDPATGTVAPYRIGDRIGGKTVEAIEDERVVLRDAEGTIEIRLSDEKPGVVKRPAATAPGASGAAPAGTR